MMSKSWINIGLSTVKGLAWRLLHARGKILADTVVYALIIYAVGCIIPTPLDQQSATINQHPSLRPDKADPQFGPIIHMQDDLFELSIGADDPDLQDELHARLFQLDPTTNKLIYLGNNEILLTSPSVPDPNDPSLRLGTFAAQPFCLGRSTTNGPILLYVVVADRPFSTTDPSMVVAGGLTDSNHWELTCD